MNILAMTSSSTAFCRSKWLQSVLFLLLLLGGHPAYAQNTNATNAAPKPAPAVVPVVPSLVSNGDFSVATNDPKWPDGWTHPKEATYKTEKGIHFVRLTSPSPGAEVFIYQKFNLPKPLPPVIELRVRVRYHNVKAGVNPWFDARVVGNFEDAEGKGIKEGGALPVPFFTGTTTKWVKKNVFARVPPSAASLEIMPFLYHAASGTFDVARVEIFPATEDQLLKAPPIIPPAMTVPTNPSAVSPK